MNFCRQAEPGVGIGRARVRRFALTSAGLFETQLVAQIVCNPFLNGTTIRLDGAVRLPPR